MVARNTTPRPSRNPDALSEANLEFLNLTSQAAILLDLSTGAILYANSAFLRLTAFSLQDLTAKPISVSLGDAAPSTWLDGDDVNVWLQRYKRPAIPVIAQIYRLEAMRPWAIVSMILPDAHPLRRRQRQLSALDSIIDLIALLDETEPDVLLRRCTFIVQGLMEADEVIFYQALSSELGLRKVAGTQSPSSLPEFLSINDIPRLTELTLWAPGRRMHTELQRRARASGVQYLACIPIGQTRAISGLLVTAHASAAPTDEELYAALLTASAGAITSIFQQSLRFNEIRQQAGKISGRLKIQNSILENTEQGVLVLNQELKVIEINPAAEILLDYTASEAVGQLVEHILIGSGYLMQALESACRGLPTHNPGIVMLHRRNGVVFPARVQILPVMDGDALLAITVLINDTSEQVRSRTRTQQLEHRALLGEFSAVFAHEVRNPINNISTGLQFLEMDLAPEDPNLDVVRRAREDCNRLSRLMSSLLEFSKPFAPKFEAVDLRSLLQRLMDRWRAAFSRARVNAQLEVDIHLPWVWGDPQLLEQVFTNLISNAVDAMSPDGGVLTIRTQIGVAASGHGHIEIMVSDTGPGIPDEVRSRIFEPFVTTKSQGTGLGLAFSKRIVTAHRGTITLESYIGGTIFHIVLPISEGEPDESDSPDR